MFRQVPTPNCISVHYYTRAEPTCALEGMLQSVWVRSTLPSRPHSQRDIWPREILVGPRSAHSPPYRMEGHLLPTRRAHTAFSFEKLGATVWESRDNGLRSPRWGPRFHAR